MLRLILSKRSKKIRHSSEIKDLDSTTSRTSLEILGSDTMALITAHVIMVTVTEEVHVIMAMATNATLSKGFSVSLLNHSTRLRRIISITSPTTPTSLTTPRTSHLLDKVTEQMARTKLIASLLQTLLATSGDKP